MSSFFNPTPLIVVDGDTAKAADLNLYGTSLNASFDLVESTIATVNTDAELWAGVSEEWAEKPEDVEVEVGKYSSLHWSAKSEGHSDDSSTYATNSSNSANASEVSNVAAGVAQVAAELAETNSETAQGLSEDAKDASVVAQGLSEDAKDASVVAQGLSEDAKDASVVAQGLSEDAALSSLGYSDNSQLKAWEAEAARQTSDNYAVTVENTYVDIVTSDGDGTYTSTLTTDYSALHWAAKSVASEEFASGTKMVFYQASAPTGWTQDAAHNNKMLRVVSGSGGGSGGSDSPILMDKVPTHNHTASSNSTGTHAHIGGVILYTSSNMAYGSNNVGGNSRYDPNITPTTGGYTANTSSNGSHSHSITINNNSGSNWTPLYIDLIICTKD